jgi:hypothetical protein
MPLSGPFFAVCETVHDGITRPANEIFDVAQNDNVILRHNATEADQKIPVNLLNQVYYWHIIPKSTYRVLNGSAYRLFDTQYANGVLNVSSGEVRPLVNTPEFTVTEDLLAFPFSNHVWFLADGVRSRTYDSKVRDIVYAPRWAQVEGIPTSTYVITQDYIHVLDDQLNTAESWLVDTNTVAASADSKGRIVLGYNGRIDIWENGTKVDTIASSFLSGLHSLYVAPDDSIAIGTSAGVVVYYYMDGRWNPEVVHSDNGWFDSFDISDAYTFILDLENKRVVRMRNGNRSIEILQLDDVPRSLLLSKDGNSLYISFFDLDEVWEYDALTLERTRVITAAKSMGMVMLSDGLHLLSYNNAETNYTLADVATPTQSFSSTGYLVNEAASYRYTVGNIRPTYVDVVYNTTNMQVLKNGLEFSSGYMERGDVLDFKILADDNYYEARVVQFVGLRSMSFMFRTEPKLFPDSFVLGTVYEAFPGLDYFETFEVRGITEGYQAYLTVNDPSVLSMRIYDAEDRTPTYGPQLVVRNGMIVEVKAVVANLFAQRTPYFLEADMKQVGEWTLLPMLLSGVTLDQSHDRAQDALQPELEETRVFEQDLFTPQMFDNNLTKTVVVEAEPLYQRKTLAVDYETELLRELYSKHTYQDAVRRTYLSVTLSDSETTWISMHNHVINEWNSFEWTLLVLGDFLTMPEHIFNFHILSGNYYTSGFPFERSVWSPAIKYEMSEAEHHLYVPRSVDANYEYYYDGPSFSSPMVYELEVHEVYEQEFEQEELLQNVYVAVPYEPVFVRKHIKAFDLPESVPIRNFIYKVDGYEYIPYDKPTGYRIEAFDWTRNATVQWYTFDAPITGWTYFVTKDPNYWDGYFNKLVHGNPLGYDPMPFEVLDENFYPIETYWKNSRLSSGYAIDREVVLERHEVVEVTTTPVLTRERYNEVAATPMLYVSTPFEIAGRSPQIVHTLQEEVASPDSGYFDTEAEALAALSAMSVAGSAVQNQYGWFLLVDPNFDTIACSLDPTPPTAGGFGYMGGG